MTVTRSRRTAIIPAMSRFLFLSSLLLAGADQWVTELRPDRFSLEDVFLELTASTTDEVDHSAAVAPPTARLEEVTT